MRAFINCCCHPRAIAVLPLKTVILSGTYAKKWSVTIYTDESITRITFQNSTEAKREFKKYRKYIIKTIY
jgi:hypothetical protein